MKEEFEFKLRPDFGDLEFLKERCIDTLMKNAMQQVVKAHDEMLIKVIKEKLVEHGYAFESQEEFLVFCKKRILNVSCEGMPYHKKLYLVDEDVDLKVCFKEGDFMDDEKMVYLFSYNNEIKSSHTGNTITYYIEPYATN